MDAVQCNVHMNNSVADFYAGKSVFITGGTGFLGKVIIEKLLYSCPKLVNIYMLIREKHNLNVQQRLEKLKDMPIFERLKNENSHLLTKIVPIAGDISLPKLGIKPEDRELLLNEVNIVINSAANVKFNEKLKTALDVNYTGTTEVLSLCQLMDNLQVFVHVSTAYTNTATEVIEETVYPLPVDINELYEKLKETSEKEESKLLWGKPNSYTFTKALSESYILENHGNIPTVIVKPSAVTGSKSEPVEGWVDSWSGVTTFLTGTSRGFCRAVISKRENILDVIPVDYVSNLVIVAAAKCHTSKDLQVFNSCTSSVNPITIGRISDMFTELSVKNGCNVIPFPKVLMTQCKWLFWIVILFTEMIPAYIADFCYIQFGSPPIFIKIQAKVSEFRKYTEYFSRNSWLIQNGKALALASSLSPQDAVLFPCDPRAISWPAYVTTYFDGVKRFLIDGQNKK